jgi:hypothetical protein
MKASGAASVACLVISLNLAPSANAAHPIRTDTGTSQFPGTDNGWNPCGASCPTLPSGLTVNPFGSDPATAPILAYALGGSSTSVQVPGGGGDTQQSWSVNVPGLSNFYTSNGITAQVLYFNLSNQPSQTVYAPPNASNQSTKLGPANGTVWEIEFNYGQSTALGATANPTTSASLDLNGKIYTASATVLDNSNSDEFVDYGGKLYAPAGWVESSGSSGAAEAPELNTTTTGSAITLLLCGLGILLGGRRRTDTL